MASPSSKIRRSTGSEARRNDPNDEDVDLVESFSKLNISENAHQHCSSTPTGTTPKSGSTLNSYKKLCDTIRRDTTLLDERQGSIYVSRHINSPGFVKCGFTARKEQATKCEYEVEPAYHSPPILCAYRAEQILYRLLATLGTQKSTCTCGQKHRGWYQVPLQLVILWIDRVTGWMESQQPYEKRSLTEVWERNLQIFDESFKTAAPKQWEEFFTIRRFVTAGEFLAKQSPCSSISTQSNSPPAKVQALSSSPNFPRPQQRAVGQESPTASKHVDASTPNSSSPTPQNIESKEECSSEASDAQSGSEVQDSEDDQEIDDHDRAGDGVETHLEKGLEHKGECSKNGDQCEANPEIGRKMEATAKDTNFGAKAKDQAEPHKDDRPKEPEPGPSQEPEPGPSQEPEPGPSQDPPPAPTRRPTFIWNPDRWSNVSFNFAPKPSKQDLPPVKLKKTFSFRQAAATFPVFSFTRVLTGLSAQLDARQSQQACSSTELEPIPAVVQTPWMEWMEWMDDVVATLPRIGFWRSSAIGMLAMLLMPPWKQG
jgi:hypothetical protein